jgi:hypothetical protein
MAFDSLMSRLKEWLILCPKSQFPCFEHNADMGNEEPTSPNKRSATNEATGAHMHKSRNSGVRRWNTGELR